MKKTVVLNDSFFECLVKLGNQERKMVMNTIKLMKEDISMPSLSVHKIDREKCDSRFRSARVNSDLRIVFLTGGEYCAVVYVDHHDAAYDWCVGKYYKETVFGAGYIYDEIQGMHQQEKLEAFFKEQEYSYFQEKSLFEDKLTKKELSKLGITGIHAESILKITSEDSLMEYIKLFPEELQEALLDLYTESRTLDEILSELEDKELRDNYNRGVEISLIQKDSGRRFYVVGSDEEIEKMAEMKDFEKWTLFLHPSQKKYAQMNANGPILIEGGPGTGKTVLGIHRAVYLSQYVYPKNKNGKILFCTFSKKLAKYIEQNVKKLYAQKNIDFNVDVLGVDAFISKYTDAGFNFSNAEILEILKNIYRSYSWGKYTFDFFKYEYYQIVQRYGITRIDEYLKVDRKGMKVPLNANQRKQVWSYFEHVFRVQNARKLKTFVDRAVYLEQKIDRGEIAPMYDSIIIDEAQDLEPAKLRLLSKCVKQQTNNMMILSDYNQRIFSLRSWKNDANINIVGRTFYLKLNYRTTKEISDYACTVFFQEQEKTEYMKGFKSIVRGEDPVVYGLKNYETQNKVIIGSLLENIKRGNPLNHICVVFPFQKEVDAFKNELEKLHIKYLLLTEDVVPNEAQDDMVCLCTTKGIKGLEFPTVILASSNKIGLIGSINQDTELYVDADLKKQRDCERYVAVTRARDNLYVTYVED